MKQERERLQKEEQITDDEELALRPYLTYMPLDKTWAEQLVITAMSAVTEHIIKIHRIELNEDETAHGTFKSNYKSNYFMS
jgi:hypothetical protein